MGRDRFSGFFCKLQTMAMLASCKLHPMTRRGKPLTNKTKVSAHGISQALNCVLDEGSPATLWQRPWPLSGQVGLTWRICWPGETN
jgi:hypothetical protein